MTPHSLFISDLHLSGKTTAARKRFFEFLDGPCRASEALYILGDLFEVWVGDDDMSQGFHKKIIDGLSTLTGSGVRLFFMHGNRDFLIGSAFAVATGAKILPDPSEIELYGTRTLLTHGDTLCTDDTEYLAYRKQVRSLAWQKKTLALPLETRYKMAAEAIVKSSQSKKSKTVEIMDVTLQAVTDLFRKNAYPRLIHGHTHRPARHVYRLDDHNCERWVLTDWTAQRGGYLYCDRNGCRAIPLV
ncbi:MAG: UDP-2,3-diacylglucosamine diphosphatase [Ferrovum sp.]|jgi:UDP-2,3-diacylglucosamine hydrolase|nr:UDP-2,3-diacylglucosamine diphosphatase [Ferrovum sp.]